MYSNEIGSLFDNYCKHLKLSHSFFSFTVYLNLEGVVLAVPVTHWLQWCHTVPEEMRCPHAAMKISINCYSVLFICVTPVYVIFEVLRITDFRDRFFLFNAVCLAYLTTNKLPPKFLLDMKKRRTAGSFLHLSYF